MYVDNPFKSPAILSFCPGILGIERGLRRVGVNCRVMAYVEIEAFINFNLIQAMESNLVDAAPIWTDAKTFDARPFRGKIHGITGGYPCPGESTAGLREGHLYKGFIWPPIRKAIAAARPLWCFFENVDDHLTGTYPIVQRSLRNVGYRTEAGVYTAEEVGAPHERQRLFILALENAFSERFLGQDIFGEQSGRAETFGGGKKLANSNGNGYGTNATGTVETSCKIEAKAQWQKRDELFGQWLWNVFGYSGQAIHRFPAGQGRFQHEWEHKRVIESGMGCTIDGYNFRQDILRALGNSVVEQVAELAFVDLLRKHFENNLSCDRYL